MAKTMSKTGGKIRYHPSVLQVRPDGAVEIKRDTLHASDGYKRQVAALIELEKEMKKPQPG